MPAKRARVPAAAAAEAAAAASSESAPSGISDYEQSRLDNIAKNAAFLASLGLDNVRADIRASAEEPKSKRRATSKGVVKKFFPTEPTRKSARAAGVTVDYTAVNIDTALVQAEAPRMAERILAEISLHAPINGREGKEQCKVVPFLSALKKPSAKAAKAAAPAGLSDAELLKKFSSLAVKEEDVAKVLESRIYSLCVHPSESKLLVAGGDSHGHVGLWDVDAGESGTGGVYRYACHVEGVMKVAVDPSSPSRIYSASYDGTIKFTDVSKEAICVAFEAPEAITDLSFTDTHFEWGASLAYIGRSDGRISCKDLRIKGEYESTVSVGHENKVNSLQISPADANVLVSSSSGPDGCIMVSDVRKLGGKASHQLNRIKDMAKTCNGVSISQDGRFLLCVGQDDTLRAYSDFAAAKGMQSRSVAHNNHTGRWLASLKPTQWYEYGIHPPSLIPLLSIYLLTHSLICTQRASPAPGPRTSSSWAVCNSRAAWSSSLSTRPRAGRFP